MGEGGRGELNGKKGRRKAAGVEGNLGNSWLQRDFWKDGDWQGCRGNCNSSQHRNDGKAKYIYSTLHA